MMMMMMMMMVLSLRVTSNTVIRVLLGKLRADKDAVGAWW
jgi:hypothetical protein